MYESLSAFAQTGGLILFIIAFILVLIYALRPSNRERFRRAARIPLGGDSPDRDEQSGRKPGDRGERQ